MFKKLPFGIKEKDNLISNFLITGETRTFLIFFVDYKHNLILFGRNSNY